MKFYIVLWIWDHKSSGGYAILSFWSQFSTMKSIFNKLIWFYYFWIFLFNRLFFKFQQCCGSVILLTDASDQQVKWQHRLLKCKFLGPAPDHRSLTTMEPRTHHAWYKPFSIAPKLTLIIYKWVANSIKAFNCCVLKVKFNLSFGNCFIVLDVNEFLAMSFLTK